MQWLALEPDALLTYVSIIIITTRAVVMPKKSVDTTVNRGKYFFLKIYQNRGEVSEGCPAPGREWHSGLRIARAPPPF